MLFRLESQRCDATSRRTLSRLTITSCIVEVTGRSGGVVAARTRRTSQMSVSTGWTSESCHTVQHCTTQDSVQQSKYNSTEWKEIDACMTQSHYLNEHK